jgi:hypothetical protein
MMRAGTERELAAYLLKGTTIWSKCGSRIPMAILSDLRSTGQGIALWQEFTSAATHTRRMQVVTSTGIDALCARDTNDPST